MTRGQAVVVVCGLVVAVALAIANVVYGDVRHPATVRAFEQLTGYPHGRSGFVVDHAIPLCAGGPDATSNMAWQLKALSYQKDVFERHLCFALKQQGYRLVKVTP